jgi:hypothetical protein
MDGQLVRWTVLAAQSVKFSPFGNASVVRLLLDTGSIHATIRFNASTPRGNASIVRLLLDTGSIHTNTFLGMTLPLCEIGFCTNQHLCRG